MKKKKIVAVSGYFNPLHIGHLNILEAAKKLGDYLIVILNRDKQARLKGSVPFMNEKDRMRIISALKPVDKVVLAKDKDKTVRKTLGVLKPDIFANGGDRRNAEDIPEADICQRLGIKMVFNVGGKKIESSSLLIKKAAEHSVTERRPWGQFTVIYQNNGLTIKTIAVNAGAKLSLQSHKNRREAWLKISGSPSFEIADKYILPKDKIFYWIGRKIKHRLLGGKKGGRILEISFGRFDENDITRYEDDYGRCEKKI